MPDNDSFQTSNTPQEQSSIFSTRRTFYGLGKEYAADLGGAPEVFLPALHTAYGEICKIIAQNEKATEEHKQNLNQNKVRLEGEKKEKQVSKDAKEVELSKTKKEIEDKRKEIQKLNNPDKEENDETKNVNKVKKPSKVIFYIGCFIIAVLTIYLFVFYSSTAYSAFFRNFNSEVVSGNTNGFDIGTAKTIFDARAVTKAWNDGATELILILTIPIIFLALGYLIHKFTSNQNDKKRYLKISVLVLITFIYDVILAYSITKKGYDFWLENIVIDPQNYPQFNLLEAIQSSDFWLVIFSGFVVYIIWGLLFNFVMEEYYKLDTINIKIKALEDDIKILEAKCKELESQIKDIISEITKIDTEIGVVNQKLKQPPTPEYNDVALEINHFTTGWLAYMNYQNLSYDQRCRVVDIKENFLKEIQNGQITTLQNTVQPNTNDDK